MTRLLTSTCGDGVVEPGEPCDDGNRVDGDGCDANCLLEPCVSCTGGPSSCAVGPRPSCLVSLKPERSKLAVVQGATDEQDKFVWKWREGEAIDASDFGHPATLTHYDLCVYDGTDALTMPMTALPNGTCNGKPCWTVQPTRIIFRDRDASSDGLIRLLVKAGQTGAAKIAVKGKGASLPDPTHPFALPITVQLQRRTGECWGATYTETTVTRNTSDLLKGNATF